MQGALGHPGYGTRKNTLAMDIAVNPLIALDGDINSFTDLYFLQSTYNSKLHNYKFLACFSNATIIYSCYEASFYMPHKMLNLMLV